MKITYAIESPTLIRAWFDEPLRAIGRFRCEDVFEAPDPVGYIFATNMVKEVVFVLRGKSYVTVKDGINLFLNDWARETILRAIVHGIRPEAKAEMVEFHSKLTLAG